jgi:hypothetical protein
MQYGEKRSPLTIFQFISLSCRYGEAEENRELNFNKTFINSRLMMTLRNDLESFYGQASNNSNGKAKQA